MSLHMYSRTNEDNFFQLPKITFPLTGGMPSGQAAHFRQAVAAVDRSQLDLQKNPYSNTGFTGIIKVKGGKFQARVQIPGEGRGGCKKRRQCSVPGVFDTAEDAAVSLALFKKELQKDDDGRLRTPPKQNKPHKSRTVQPREPAATMPEPVAPSFCMATAMAVPVPFMVQHAPIVAATPLPMRPY